jgi:hypothetical protein
MQGYKMYLEDKIFLKYVQLILIGLINLELKSYA